MCVIYKVVKDELIQLKKKLAQLDDVAQQLSPLLDPVASASVGDSKATLDRRVDNLQSRLWLECDRLESTMDEQSKFTEKCRVIETFLKTLPSEEIKPSAVSIPAAQRNVTAAKEVLVTVENMQPEMTRLNELGREVSVSDDEIRKLAALNERWETICREKDEDVKRQEQLLIQVEQFTERCDQWTLFVSRIETDLQPQPMSSYESLLDRQQKIEVVFSTLFNDVILHVYTVVTICLETMHLLLSLYNIGVLWLNA